MSSKKYPIYLKQKAQNLRLDGKSYTQIMKLLSLRSKGTVSSWLSNLVLTPRAKLLLQKNNEKVHKNGLFKANKERTKKINLENSKSFLYGKNKINKIDMYSLLVLGTALYWGEGTKAESNVPARCALVFTNSDPLMVSVFMKFLRLVMDISEDRIRGGIHLYDSIDRNKAIKFWSRITKISRDRFYIVNQVSRASKSKRATNSLPFGTFVVRVRGRSYFYIIKGMIEKLFEITKTF